MTQVDAIRAAQTFALVQGLRLDPKQASAGGILVDQQIRWHMIIPPAAPRGPVISLRRHAFQNISLDSFSTWRFGAREILGKKIDQLRNSRRPVLIYGETGSGKTSLLVCILRQAALWKRVLILEQLRELPSLGKSWTTLLSHGPNIDCHQHISIYDLFLDGLRLRPDWFVFGELRGNDLKVLGDAIESGHPGVMTTVHAGSKADLNRRLCASGNTSESLRSANPIYLFVQRGHPPQVEIED